LSFLVFPSFSGGHVFKEELLFVPADEPADVPELLDVTEELLLASVDELDLALDDDFAELLEELSPLEESDSLEGRSPTESGKTDESSSPQATIKVNATPIANNFTKFILLPQIISYQI
jgi:hypothetical protein